MTQIYLIDDNVNKQSHFPLLLEQLGSSFIDGFDGKLDEAHRDANRLYEATSDPSGICLIDIQLPYAVERNSHQETIEALKALIKQKETEEQEAEISRKFTAWTNDKHTNFGEKDYHLAAWLFAICKTKMTLCFSISTQQDADRGFLNDVAKLLNIRGFPLPDSPVPLRTAPGTIVHAAEEIKALSADRFWVNREMWINEELPITALFASANLHDLHCWREDDCADHANHLETFCKAYFLKHELKAPVAIKSNFPDYWPLIFAKLRVNGSLHRSLIIGLSDDPVRYSNISGGVILRDPACLNNPILGAWQIDVNSGSNGGVVLEAMKVLMKQGFRIDDISIWATTPYKQVLCVRLVGNSAIGHDPPDQAADYLNGTREEYLQKKERRSGGLSVYACQRLRSSGIPAKADGRSGKVLISVEFREVQFIKT